ncbi:MAG: ATP-binding cassette domain-containing protein [Crocinitomicaceae bacterium]|nr:ATP-binding cassette domain-containing protein [Crocinitomicaceae bacterium]MBT5402143.1 ATP-binding cassette domain-containing protein [Crocinitomicaceae bacterium]
MERKRNKTGKSEERTKISKESWKKSVKIFKYLKPYRGTYIIGLICLLISTGTSLLFPNFLGDLLGADTAQQQETFHLLDTNNINALFIMLMLIFVVQALFGFFRIYLFGVVSENALRDIRQDAFEKLITLSVGYYDKNKVGKLQSHVSADISQLSETFTITIAEFLRQVLTIFAGIVLIALISPKLSLIMLSIVPVIAVSAVLFGRFIRSYSRKAQDAIAVSNGLILDALTGIKNVKIFVNERFEALRYTKAIDEVKTLSIKSAVWRGLFASFIILAMFGSVIWVIWQGMGMVQMGPENGGITSAEFFKFLLLTVMIGASFGGVSSLFGNIQKAVGATERLMEILEEKSEDIAISHQQSSSSSKIAGNVTFDKVHFAYESRPDLTILKGVSFSAKSGEQIAIVGSSGSGKSTISALLLRFYEPTEGSISIDGLNSTQYALQDLRSEIAVVPQEVLLFGGSIKENIAYGKPQATEDEILDAASKANAMEFIDKFPEKLNTLIGDRGVQLSGGQRQRIAIARAVLKNPSILILDEATSSLDSGSESLVQQALERIMIGRTTFVIAHRLSTVRKATKILVLENGQIIEEGKHEELIIKENGVYKNLSALQFEES